MSQVGGVCEIVHAYYQCVSAVMAVEIPVFICLRNSCNYVAEGGGP
jgi:hypothetical protein